MEYLEKLIEKLRELAQKLIDTLLGPEAETEPELIPIRPVRNIISSLKCLHHKQLKEYNSFLISHSFSSELN